MFEAYTGKVLRTTRPPQGCNFEVTLLEAEQGSFIVKTSKMSWLRQELEEEATIVAALADYPPLVPRFIAREGNHFLFTYIEGVNLSVTMAETRDAEGRAALAQEYGQFLRRIHSWAPDLPKPKDWVLQAVRQCRKQAREGRPHISPYSIHAERDGLDVLEILTSQRHEFPTVLVFGHGDWCLPNALVQGKAVSGAVDWSSGGYADYRYDLATALWSLRYNLNDDPTLPQYLSAFLDGYGYTDGVQSLAFFEAIYALL